MSFFRLISKRFMPLLFAALLLSGFIAKDAMAVPSFARETGLGCAACHANWPTLTKMGRDFKENGYRMGSDSGKTISDYLKLSSVVPVSARFNMRLLDKRTAKGNMNVNSRKDINLKMRALHEAALFLAGTASDKVSFFAEFAAEDEWPDPAGVAPGFQVQLETGYIDYHISDVAAIYMGLGSPLLADGYNTVHSHKNVRHDWAVATKGFLPGEAQFISVSGRPMEQLFYILAWSGNDLATANEPSSSLEGKDPKDLTLRLAYDIMDNIMVGGYYQQGRQYNGTSSNDDFSKYGVDLQADVASFLVNAVIAGTNKDTSDAMGNAKSTSESALSVSVQHFMKANDFLSASCKLIFSQYTKEDGDKKYSEAGLFFTKFLGSDNFKAQLGWEGELDTPFEEKESRYSLVFDLGI